MFDFRNLRDKLGRREAPPEGASDDDAPSPSSNLAALGPGESDPRAVEMEDRRLLEEQRSEVLEQDVTQEIEHRLEELHDLMERVDPTGKHQQEGAPEAPPVGPSLASPTEDTTSRAVQAPAPTHDTGPDNDRSGAVEADGAGHVADAAAHTAEAAQDPPLTLTDLAPPGPDQAASASFPAEPDDVAPQGSSPLDAGGRQNPPPDDTSIRPDPPSRAGGADRAAGPPHPSPPVGRTERDGAATGDAAGAGAVATATRTPQPAGPHVHAQPDVHDSTTALPLAVGSDEGLSEEERAILAEVSDAYARPTTPAPAPVPGPADPEPGPVDEGNSASPSARQDLPKHDAQPETNSDLDALLAQAELARPDDADHEQDVDSPPGSDGAADRSADTAPAIAPDADRGQDAPDTNGFLDALVAHVEQARAGADDYAPDSPSAEPHDDVSVSADDATPAVSPDPDTAQDAPDTKGFLDLLVAQVAQARADGDDYAPDSPSAGSAYVPPEPADDLAPGMGRDTDEEQDGPGNGISIEALLGQAEQAPPGDGRPKPDVPWTAPTYDTGVSADGAAPAVAPDTETEPQPPHQQSYLQEMLAQVGQAPSDLPGHGPDGGDVPPAEGTASVPGDIDGADQPSPPQLEDQAAPKDPTVAGETAQDVGLAPRGAESSAEAVDDASLEPSASAAPAGDLADGEPHGHQDQPMVSPPPVPVDPGPTADTKPSLPRPRHMLKLVTRACWWVDRPFGFLSLGVKQVVGVAGVILVATALVLAGLRLLGWRW